MGAWSIEPFANDSALDWVSNLLDSPAESWVEAFNNALHKFLGFEESRRQKRNFSVRTRRDAEKLISMFKPPIDPYMEQIILEGVGKEYEYSGDDETFSLIAAGELIRIAASGDRDNAKLPADFPLALLANVPIGLAQNFASTLRLIPNNKTLCRDCGPKWRKSVLALATALDDIGRTP